MMSEADIGAEIAAKEQELKQLRQDFNVKSQQWQQYATEMQSKGDQLTGAITSLKSVLGKSAEPTSQSSTTAPVDAS